MSFYNHKEIEPKWQKYWADHHTFKTGTDASKPKFYALDMFPYPSGAGLHVGHPEGYTATDILSRFKGAQGYNVLHPMGWDAFGLPAEQYAMDTGNDPAEFTAENIANFKRQINSLGFSYDWDREVNTTDPNYYKWTQWIFTKLYEKGLAYEAEVPVNWVEELGTAIANEEVLPDGTSERGGYPVVRKPMRQWMLKITAYAERLLNDLDDLDWPESIKDMQRNWIGKSTGANVTFKIKDTDKDFTVFTTRPDTLFGATYMVISPEHPLIEKWADKLENMDEIRAYQEKAARKSDFERTEMAKEKTGVCLKGVRGINPVNDKEIPIFVSDYVLMSYGTGAIMAVPAHDTRDYEFAKVFDLPIIEVVKGGDVTKEAFTDCATGTMVNSGFLDGMSVEDAKVKIKGWLEATGKGKSKVNYKLRDWVFSRQRYWGEPIPVVYCDKCGWVGLPESELPLTLPDVESYMPTDTGESPLSTLESFINTTCPKCGGAAKRETDTMPQWAGSSWYYLRYCDPKNPNGIASKEALNYWMPVDWYNGGMEHTTLHLLYSRFWHKFLYDIGVVNTKEPYKRRTSHGMILGEDPDHPGKFTKMSKSKGNVINPDDVVKEYGADTLRLYEMFVGDFEKAAPWSTSSIRGCKRFLDRIWALQDNLIDGDTYREQLVRKMHQTIQKVSNDIETLKFNTAIAAMMELLNEITATGSINKAEFQTLLILLNPFAPHITEELYETYCGGILHEQSWPTYDEALCKEDTIEIVVQINGKVRCKMNIAVGAEKEAVLEQALAEPKIAEAVAGKQLVKQIYVPNKLVNFVAK